MNATHTNREIDRAREESSRAGNWQRFGSFAWHDRPDDGEAWAHVSMGMQRDASALDESNHRTARRSLCEVDPDQEHWNDEHAGHWAVGWVDGFSIRCIDPSTGEPTPAWIAWVAMEDAIASYPILDESDESELEMEREGEAWSNHGASDFRAALRALDPSVDRRGIIDAIPDGALWEAWTAIVDAHHCGERCTHESDGGVHFAFVRALRGVAWPEARAYLRDAIVQSGVRRDGGR